MALNPRELIQYAKAAPRSLRVIAAVAAVDIIVLLLAAFTLEGEVDDRVAKIDQLRSELTGLRAKLETTRKEIARLPELRQKYDAAMSDGVLADQDRQKFVGHSQELADQHRLADLHYKLEAQETAPGMVSGYSLVTTPVSLSLSGLLDSDVLEYWDEILGNLQSHYQITKATLDREEMEPTAALDAIRAGRPAPLVKSELSFRWVSLHKTAAAPAAASTGANAPAAPVGASSAAPPAPATQTVNAATGTDKNQ